MTGRVIIAGAGSLGRELRRYLNLAFDGLSTKRIVFLDDIQANRVELPVIGKLSEASFLIDAEDTMLIACADPTGRRKIYEDLASFPPSGYQHPSSIGADMHGAEGLMMMPFSLISADAHIGKCLLMNTHADIGHDAIVGDFVTLCSRVTLTGNVIVGDDTFIGTGAVVIPGVKIGHGCYIGAGSVVVRDLAPGSRVFGNPARSIT